MSVFRRRERSEATASNYNRERLEAAASSYDRERVRNKIINRYSWLAVASIGTAVAVGAFIIIYLTIDGEPMEIDVPTILTTLLAFFSIFLSSFFYFKTTEQSNQFYDRSYNHTRDIAKTLSSMEGKFGEALKNIEQYSTRLNDRFDSLPIINNSLQNDVIGEVQKNLTELLEQVQVGNVTQDLIQDYEERFNQIQKENYELKDKLNRNNKYVVNENDEVNTFFLSMINELGVEKLKSLSKSELKEVVEKEIIFYLGSFDLYKLKKAGIFDEDLKITKKGIEIFTLLIKTVF